MAGEDPIRNVRT